MGGRQLRADAQQRLIEAEAGFDADDQQVQRVGQRELDPVLRRFASRASPMPGHDVAEQVPPSANMTFGWMTSGVASSRNAAIATLNRMP